MSDATPPSTQACAAPAAPRSAAGAWQPFTGGGVGRFADAAAGRTAGFLGAFALATALVLGWTLQTAWWPVVDLAIRGLPEQGMALAKGRLEWPEPAARLLADSPHLGIAVRPDGQDALGRTADLQVELLPAALRVAGIAGFVEWPWPRDWELGLGRLETRAAWEAWRRPVLAASVGAVAGGLAASWSLVAVVLATPLRIAALVLRRRITLGGCWRLGSAAFVGASPVLALGLAGYALRWLPWPALAGVIGIHVLAAGLLMCWGLLNRPSATTSPAAANPFRPGGPGGSRRKRRGNPFG